MKHPYIVLVLFLIFYTATAQVGIGTTSPNAQLDIKSSSQATPANNDGILIPKVDTFPAVNPTALQDGMMVYLTTTAGPNQPGFYYWDNSTNTWKSVGGEKGWTQNGNSGTTPISNSFALLNENFVGTSDATDLSIGANKMEYIRLKSGIDNVGFFNKNPDYNLDLQTSITGITQPRNGLRIKDIMQGSSAQRGSFFGFDHNNFNETLVWTYGDNEYYINDKSIRLGIGNEAVNQTLAKFTYRSIGLFGDNPNYTLDIKTAPNDAVFHTLRRNGIRINTPLSNSNNDLAGLFIGIKENGFFQDANESYIWNYGDGIATNSFISFGAGPDVATGEIMRLFKDKIGIGTTTPTNGAILDINSSYAGILIPRVSLSDVTSAGPILVLTKSLLVYNNNPFIIGGDGEGYYYWNGTKWIKLLTDNDNKWSITGNSGTNSSTHFIGTTDNNDLIFKRNNVKSGSLGITNTSLGFSSLTSLSSGTDNSAFGASVLSSNTSGSRNIGIGNNALSENVSGNDKIAIGYDALAHSDSSDSNIAIGSRSQTWNWGNYNTSIGYQSLWGLFNGTGNSAFGYSALEGGSMHSFNTAVGYQSLRLTNQNQNTAVGYNSISQCMNCGNNTAIGYMSQSSTNNGSNNVSIGSETLLMNEGGSFQTAIGTNALRQNVTGTYNTAVGGEALKTNYDGSYNTAVGYQSLYGHNNGDGNSAFGYYAMRASDYGSNNTATGFQSLFFNQGSGNTAQGYNSLFTNINGGGNTAIGYQSMYLGMGNFNTSIGYESLLNDVGNIGSTALGSFSLRQNIGSGNTATGYESLRQNTSGINNTANGYQTLKNQTTGNSNAAFGNNTLFSNTIGSYNTATGSDALSSNSSGNYNTALGFSALGNNTIGIQNTGIGYNAIAAQNNLTNATAIGANSYVSASNSLVLGSINGLNGATNDVNVGIGTTSPSNKLHVVGNIRMVDGNQSAGKVLTSDINGVGTWQTLSTPSYWTRNGSGQLYTTTLTDNVGIGTNTPNAPLQFSNAVVNRKIVLYDTNNNDNQYYGFGINGGTLRYQTDATGADHVFFAGVNSTTSNELMRIKGTGNVGIGTNNPTTKLEINGYTKLGSDAPAIRVIKLTGTTSNVQNGTVTIPHGLNPAKILSATVLVEYFTNSYVPASYSRTGYEFDFYITGANIYIWNSAANSGSILSKPMKIMITYEE